MSDLPKRHMKDVIYEEYLGRIQRGELAEEDRLVDTAIAAEFNVSRMPVRDALMRLAHEGYLASSTRGFTLPELTPRQILEIFELRRLIEPRAAALADARAQARRGQLREWVRERPSGLSVRAIAEDRFPFSTGACFDVDGGFHLHRL